MLIAEPEATHPEEYRLGSIEDRMAPPLPPLLLVNGTDDTTITIPEVEMCRDRWAAAGGQVELVKLEGVPHGFGYGVSTDAQKAALAAVAPFLARNLLA
jgi:acetyl esterase/lipase